MNKAESRGALCGKSSSSVRRVRDEPSAKTFAQAAASLRETVDSCSPPQGMSGCLHGNVPHRFPILVSKDLSNRGKHTCTKSLRYSALMP